MKRNCRDIMIQVMRFMELLIAGLIVVAIMVALWFYALDAWSLAQTGDFTLDTFMNGCLSLIVGIEFVKMLILHTPESILEVLLFVVARYVVMSHSQSIDILLGMLSIGIIFLIRKYLFQKGPQEELQ